MKYCAAVGRYAPGRGGVDEAVRMSILAAALAGFETSVLCFETTEGRIPVRVVEPKLLSIRRSVAAALSDLSPDVVHVHSYSSILPWAVVHECRDLGIPVIFSPHFHPRGAHNRVSRAVFDVALGRYSLRQATLIIVMTAHESALLAPILPANSTVEVLPTPLNSVHLETRGNAASARAKYGLGASTVLFVGRLDKTKGLTWLLSSMARIRRRVPETKLLVIGENKDMVQAIRKTSVALGITDMIVLAGVVSSADLLDAYAASSVLVLPSQYEAEGLVLLEAMAHGVPFVATRVGGVPEVLGSTRAGLLVEYGDTQGLVDAMTMFLTDEAAAKAAVSAGAERVKAFDERAYLTKLGSILQSLTDS